MTLISSTESLNSDVDPTAKQVDTSSSVDSLVSGLQKKLQILKTAQSQQPVVPTKSSVESVKSAASANHNYSQEDFHQNNKNQKKAEEGLFQKAFKRFDSGPSKNTSTSLVVEQEKNDKKAAAEKKIIEVVVDPPIKIVNGKEEFTLRFDQEEQDLKNSKLKAEVENAKNVPKVNGKEELYLRFIQDRPHSKLEASKNTGSIARWAKKSVKKCNY